MRSVLIVLGIACLALLLALGLSKKKDLSPNPQEDAAIRQLEDQQKEQAADAKAKRDKLTKGAAPEPEAPLPAPDNSVDYFKDKFTPPANGVVTAVMTIQGKGDITVELYPKDAPQTVTQFGTLIKNKFYDGMKFHRVVSGFVVQGGDPLSKAVTAKGFSDRDDGQGGTDGLGANGSGRKIPFEVNSKTNEPGTLAMALSGPKSDTGDSQFFINLVQNSMLDGDYCVFGKVTKGMDIVQKIQRGDVITQFHLQ